MVEKMKSFNPYSPGFSIYLLINHAVCGLVESFNPYSPGFSIYLMKQIIKVYYGQYASILIHLDFLSIFKKKNT